MLSHLKMPAKKNMKKTPKRSDAVEMKRRAAQSARDKAATRTKMGKKQQGIAASYVPAVRAGSMPKLAMCIAAPQHMPPMRLPTVSRQKTDVKHLWQTGVYSFSKPGSGSYVYAASRIGYVPGATGQDFMSEQLPQNSALFALTRDVVTPIFVPVPFQVPSNAPAVWYWNPYWPEPQATFNQNPSLTQQWSQPVVVVFAGTNTTAGETFTVSPPSHLAKTGPVQVMPFSQTALDMTPNNIPAARNSIGQLYGWHGLGDIIVDIRLIDNTGAPFTVPAGASTQTILTVQRYKGPGTIDESTDESVVTITAGVSSNSRIFVSMPAGYYNVVVANVTYYASAGITTLGIAYQVRVYSHHVNASGSFGTAIFPANNTSLPQATYMLEKSRLNAAALLLSNVSSSVSKAGELWGVREAGKENFFTFLTTSAITSLAGASGTAYYGPLAKGGYTFLEPPANADVLNDYALALSGDYGGVVLPVSCLDVMAVAHIYYAAWPAENAFGTSTMLSYRADTHIEFVSNSQLATLGITADPVAEYTNATIVLSAGAYFYENPTHMEQLWGWIKKTGAAVLKAGASAAARTALEAGTLALGTLML